MKVLILLSAITLAFARERVCGANQRYLECGTACPLTCDNYDNPPKICVAMCVSGCHCEEGYIKTRDGRCVRPEECPARQNAVCGENQRYDTCGSACPLTCDNYDNPPKICPAMCVIGCHCERGYVKTRDGRCVRPEECQARGVKRPSGSDVCSLPAETGVCDAYFPRFFFDSERGECRRFVYGGCGGNGNNFKTIEECQRVCAPRRAPEACQLEKVVGPCRGAFRRFFHNKETGQCEEFIYGGCSGNSNNFNTKDECESVCSA